MHEEPVEDPNPERGPEPETPDHAESSETMGREDCESAEPAGDTVEEHPETKEEIDQLLMKRLQSLQRPTWELELLISGAVVFSLFQVPGRLRGWFEGVSVHAGSDIGLLPFMAFYALTLVTICLAAAFSLHFVLRSIWVGITGLQSAFPKGIEWDQIDAGPISKRVMREMNPSLEAAEDRLDAVASSIFAVLFALVVSFVAVFGLLLIPAFVGEILRARYFPSVPSMAVFYGVMIVVALPGIPVGLIDGWFKRDPARIDQHPRIYRLAYRWTKVIQFFFLGRLTSPVTLTLSSRFSLKKVTHALVASIFLTVAIFLAYFAISMGLIGFDSYVFYPDERGADFVDSRHYGDHDVDPRSEVPRIQSEVVQDPYLRLFVPFSPSRDDERIATHCPDTLPLRTEGLFVYRRPDPDDDGSARALLDCWQRVLVVAVDDQALSPDWLFHQDPATGRKGVLAFLPVDGLDAGRHELLVARRAAEEAERVLLRPRDGAFRVVVESGDGGEQAQGDGGAAPGATSSETVSAPERGPRDLEVADRDRHQIAFWVPPRPHVAALESSPEPALDSAP